MRISTEEQEKRGNTSIASFESPLSVVASILGAAASSTAFGMVKGAGKHNAVAGATSAAVGLAVGGIVGGVSKIAERYVPKGGQPNVVGDRYIRMWKTRRSKYGESGRRPL